MAGNYMDSPSDRIAWDRDGSVFVTVTQAGAVSLLSPAQAQTVNSEAESGVVPTTGAGLQYSRYAIIFPIPMDLVSYFLAYASAENISGSAIHRVETSQDTTNGVDGTWTTHGGETTTLAAFEAAFVSNVKPDYRVLADQKFFLPTSISTGVRAVRFGFANINFTSTLQALRAMHLYGIPSTTALNDRLAIWSAASDARAASTAFDWGNVPRGTSADRSFRIKNLSDTLTATEVSVYAEALTEGSPSVATMFVFSLDGGTTFASSLTIDEIAPGAISPVIIVRRVIPTNAQVSVWSARIAADVLNWEA